MLDGDAFWLSRHRVEAKQNRSAKMICVAVEIREGAITRRVQYTASSIERALELAGGGKPDRRVRLVFPIDSEVFFVSEGLGLAYQ
jgi:hypothetical protein